MVTIRRSITTWRRWFAVCIIKARRGYRRALARHPPQVLHLHKFVLECLCQGLYACGVASGSSHGTFNRPPATLLIYVPRVQPFLIHPCCHTIDTYPNAVKSLLIAPQSTGIYG